MLDADVFSVPVKLVVSKRMVFFVIRQEYDISASHKLLYSQC